MATPKSVLITGCNRGIGLELVKQFLMTKSPPSTLIATCRDPSKADELNAIAKDNSNVHVMQFDVTDFDSHDQFVKKVAEVVGPDNGLNLLINNAGVLPSQRTLEDMTPDGMILAFKTNCVGPVVLTRALLPLLKTAASKVKDGLNVGRAAAIQMSTSVASIAENGGGGLYAYRCSKTALNMAMKNLSIELKDQGILVMAMHPGWVKTEMGGPNAMIDTATCAGTMIETLSVLSEKDHGAFLRYNNTPIQW